MQPVMNNYHSNSDSELGAWASSFSGAVDFKSHADHDTLSRANQQSTPGLSSQSRSFQHSQLPFATSAEERVAVMQQLSASLERDSPQLATMTISPALEHAQPRPLPPSLPAAPVALQPGGGGTTVPAPAVTALAEAPEGTPGLRISAQLLPAFQLFLQQQQQLQQQLQQQQRSLAETVNDSSTTTKAMQSLALSHTATLDSTTAGLRHSTSSHSSSHLPPPSCIPPAAVAAAAAVVHYPLYASNQSLTEESDVGGDMVEVKRACLEDYLDLQDDDDSHDSHDGEDEEDREREEGGMVVEMREAERRRSGTGDSGAVGDGNPFLAGPRGASPGSHNTSVATTAAASASRSPSQLSNANTRSSFWMAELSGTKGPLQSQHESARAASPPSHLDAAAATVRGARETVEGGAAGATGSLLHHGSPTKQQPPPPPPLRGFTPVVVAAVSGSAAAPKSHSPVGTTTTTTTTTAASPAAAGGDHAMSGVGRPRSATTPAALSLASSTRVSPASQQSLGEGADEERRLRDELQVLRQRVAETEARLAVVVQQRRQSGEAAASAACPQPPQPLTAESSFNGGAVTPTRESSAQRLMLQQVPPPPSSAAMRLPLDTPPSTLHALSQQQQQQQMVGAMAGLAGPHYTLDPSSQQSSPSAVMSQSMNALLSSQLGPHMYLSGAQPPASVMMHGNPMTYMMQGGGSGNPYGMFTMPAGSQVMDAANLSLASLTPGFLPNFLPQQQQQQQQQAPSAMPMMTAQTVMVNGQPTLCYMMMSPAGGQPGAASQTQMVTASGVLPPPDFASVAHSSSGAPSQAKSAPMGLGHPQQPPSQLPAYPPTTTTTTTTTTAAAATAANAASSPSAGGTTVPTAAGKSGELVPGYPHIVMVGQASNGELTRKCFNVHGSMLGTVQYYPYDESAPPAPTATILPANAFGNVSLGASVLGQSMSGVGWSVRSSHNTPSTANNTNNVSVTAELALGGSCRSTEGNANTSAGDGTRSRGSATPPQTHGSPTATADLASAPVLPIFIQMFPCELHDRATVLNRVMEAACGRDVAVVQRIEPRSETSFIAHVRTHQVWHLIYKLRCRVLMDRFGFWYASDLDQYVRMKEYCEGVRRLPQQTRHFQTDGLPCMPLVVELSRAVDRGLVTENNAPRTFDEIVPIAAVDRHRTRAHSTATGQAALMGNSSLPYLGGMEGMGNAAAGVALVSPVGTTTSSSANLTASANLSTNYATMMGSGMLPPPLSLQPQQQQQQRGGMMLGAMGEPGFLNLASSLGGGAGAAPNTYIDARNLPPPFA